MVHANKFFMAILSCWGPRFLFIAKVSFRSLLLRECMSHALGLLLLSMASSLHAAGAGFIKPRSSLCFVDSCLHGPCLWPLVKLFDDGAISVCLMLELQWTGGSFSSLHGLIQVWRAGIVYACLSMYFGAVLHCLCMPCMRCKAPHWLVSFPFFSGCLWFLSTWGIPPWKLGSSILMAAVSIGVLLLLSAFSAPSWCALFPSRAGGNWVF